MRIFALLTLLWFAPTILGQGAVYGGSADGGFGGNAMTDGAGGSFGGPGGAGGRSATIAYNGSFNTVTVEHLACGSGALAGSALSILGLAFVPRRAERRYGGILLSHYSPLHKMKGGG